MYLLNRRFQQHQQIIWSGKGGVQDRTIYEDTVFAKVLMDEGSMEPREYQTVRVRVQGRGSGPAHTVCAHSTAACFPPCPTL